MAGKFKQFIVRVLPKIKENSCPPRPEKLTMPKPTINDHIEHCCKIHGCKFDEQESCAMYVGPFEQVTDCTEGCNAEEYDKELEEICAAVRRSISKILLSKDRTSKHPPYTWKDEDEDEHLNKALRHILTHQLIQSGHQKPDKEEHLNNAITRLSMAIAKEG